MGQTHNTQLWLSTRLSKHLQLLLRTTAPLHSKIYMHILHTVLFISYDTDREDLLNNQEALLLVIISLILMALMFDTTVNWV